MSYSSLFLRAKFWKTKLKVNLTPESIYLKKKMWAQETHTHTHTHTHTQIYIYIYIPLILPMAFHFHFVKKLKDISFISAPLLKFRSLIQQCWGYIFLLPMTTTIFWAKVDILKLKTYWLLMRLKIKWT